MNKLTEFRINLNESTSGMAAIIGVSKSYYEKIEYEDRNPSYNFITKFKKAFPGADVDSIFFDKQSHVECDTTQQPTGTDG
jgi:putative transcriptional regulator